VAKSKNKRKARERILETAKITFRTLGYARTTTQAIAEQAGVAEVTLFRHFKSKQGLFKAVVEDIGSTLDLNQLNEAMTGNLYQDLLYISESLLHYFIHQRETIRMIMFESAHFPEMRESLAQNPQGMIRFLLQFLQQHMDEQEQAQYDLNIVAQAFVSMHFGYAFAIEPITPFLSNTADNSTVSKHFVSIFIAGIFSDRHN
jgi:AcrR family transcriptional regulator